MVSVPIVNSAHMELGNGVLLNWLFGTKNKEQGQFVMLPNFHGVNTPTMASFQLPMVCVLAQFLNI